MSKRAREIAEGQTEPMTQEEGTDGKVRRGQSVEEKDVEGVKT